MKDITNIVTKLQKDLKSEESNCKRINECIEDTQNAISKAKVRVQSCEKVLENVRLELKNAESKYNKATKELDDLVSKKEKLSKDLLDSIDNIKAIEKQLEKSQKDVVNSLVSKLNSLSTEDIACLVYKITVGEDISDLFSVEDTAITKKTYDNLGSVSLKGLKSGKNSSKDDKSKVCLFNLVKCNYDDIVMTTLSHNGVVIEDLSWLNYNNNSKFVYSKILLSILSHHFKTENISDLYNEIKAILKDGDYPFYIGLLKIDESKLDNKYNKLRVSDCTVVDYCGTKGERNTCWNLFSSVPNEKGEYLGLNLKDCGSIVTPGYELLSALVPNFEKYTIEYGKEI